jgi:hypothetical protein
MNRSYDVFEKLPDGTLMWRATINGHEEAIATLIALAGKNSNEFQVMHLATKALIATVNGPKVQTPST